MFSAYAFTNNKLRSLVVLPKSGRDGDRQLGVAPVSLPDEADSLALLCGVRRMCLTHNES